MNALELRLKLLNPGLLNKFHDTVEEVELLLSKYVNNFPTYTDHSIKHTMEVFKITSQLLTQDEIDNLNEDEIYVLSMACILHDVGMCLPKSKLKEISKNKFEQLHETHFKEINKDFIRDIHHELSYDFIIKEYEQLKIPTDKYAEAIALVAKGHRKVALDDSEEYPPKYFVKSGRVFVCLPYLACVLRLADELDITNIRTPKLLTKYYMPNNKKSIIEWKKHISTTQINFTEDKVEFQVKCTDQNNLAALEEQFEKIQNVTNYCQKIIRTISNTEDRRFKLNIIQIVPKFQFLGFDPKGIKFSFNVQNVIKTFIGKDLYDDELVSIREAIQNSIDSCRYKQSIYKDSYTPHIKVIINKSNIKIIDNGLGMDEFIIENFFGRLGSSFYEQERIKKEFEAIGQFGIGIFSYFLLCEYIDIETKAENGIPLKFRIDKDPKNYFHFFEETEILETGTTSTLYLKDEIQTKYKLSDYKNYLKKLFKYIEFTIFVEGENESYALSRESFSLNQKTEIEKKIEIQHKNSIEKFQIIKCVINNEEYEGECAIIVNKFSKNYSLKDIPRNFSYSFFETVDRGGNKSQISISQKGVFVNNYSSHYLSLIIGNINLKRSNKISINRKEFSDRKPINRIIDDFVVDIIGNLFSEIKNRYSIEMIAKLSDEFLISYIEPYFYELTNYSKLIDVLGKNIVIKLYNGTENELITLEKLIEKFEKFILLSSFENINEVYKTIKLPIVVTSGYSYFDSFHTLIAIFVELYKFTPSITISKNKAYQILLNDKNENYLDIRKKFLKMKIYEVLQIQKFDSNLIVVNLPKNKNELPKIDVKHSDPIINSSHPYIKFVLNNFTKIINDAEFLYIVESSLKLIMNIGISKKVIMKKLNQLNRILKPLNRIEKSWSFSISDFQKSEK